MRKGRFNSLGDARHFNLPNQKNVESLRNSSHVGHVYFSLIVPVKLPFVWDKGYEEISQGAICSPLNCSGKIIAISASYLIELASPVFSSASGVYCVRLIITHLECTSMGRRRF